MKPAEIERLLPEVFRATLAAEGPLRALLDVMAQMHAHTEQVLDTLDACFDPVRTDDRFVTLLSRWLDLERLFARSAGAAAAGDPITSGLGHLRELVARASELSHWRGTRRGLIAFLETSVGLRGFEVEQPVLDDAQRPIPFRIRVLAPADAVPHRALIERIIALEKPAYTTCELVFGTPGT